MEEHKNLLFERKYIRIKIELSKNLPVFITVENEKPIKTNLSDLVLPEDLPAITAKIQEISIDNKSEIYTHFRVHFNEETHWFLICAQIEKEKLKTPYLSGLLLDVSKYIDEATNDPTVFNMRSKVDKSFSGTDSGGIRITDMIDRDYLVKIQMPFKLGNGVYSAIFDNNDKLICTPNPKDKSFDAERFKFSKRVNVRANHSTIAYWVIAAQKKETIDKNEQLLEMMCLTLSRLVNSLVLLYKEMTNSELTNKMLSENIKQQMLINSIYNEIFGIKNTGDIIESVMKLVGEYMHIDSIFIYTEDAAQRKFFGKFKWSADDKSDRHLSDELSYDDIPKIIKQLDFTDYYYPNQSEHELSADGINYYMATNLSGDGKRYGIVFYNMLDMQRRLTAQEAKMLRSVSQILSSLILKYNADLLLAEKSEEVSYLAFHDPILDVPNRAMLDKDLKEELKSEKEGAVIYIKVTNLRIFNELFGHSYTDMLLKLLTDHILSMPIDNIRLYRFSGNIITVMLSNADAVAAKKFVELLLVRFKRPWVQDGNEHYLEAGIGITLYPYNGKNCEEIYRASSLSMYRSIEYGVNSYAFYSKEFEKPASIDYFYAENLRLAMNAGMQGFHLKYQPTLNLQTGEPGPYEVFVHWSNDEDSLAPSKIVRLAENIGFDIRLDKWVIANACEFCKEMQRTIDPEFSISVNITMRELQSGTIVSIINEALRQSKLDGKYLSVEISEKILMNTRDNIIPIISRLKENKVKIVIDSFGRDFVTPVLLKYSYVDMIKADFTLFTNVFDEFDEILLDTAVKLSKTVKDGICVKRVENREQLDILQEFDINFLQGYIYSKPLKPQKLIEFMSEFEGNPIKIFQSS